MKRLLFLFGLLSIACLAQGKDDYNKIRCGKDGSLYVLTTYKDYLILPNGDSLYNGDEDNFESLALIKLDSLGMVLWAKNMRGVVATTSGSGSPGFGLALDEDDNTYVAIGYQLRMSLEGEFEFEDESSNPHTLIMKFDSQGVLSWYKTPSYEVYSYGIDVALDGKGGLYVTGKYGRGEFGFDSLSPLTNQAQYGDAYIVKFDLDGNALWQEGIYDGHQYVSGISVNSLGESYVYGSLHASGTLTFGEETKSYSNSSFIAKTGVDGNPLSLKLINTNYAGDILTEVVTFDEENNLYTTGSFSEYVDFGEQVSLTTTGRELYVTKFNEEIEALDAVGTSSEPGVSGPAWGTAMAYHKGHLVLAGSAYGERQFSPLEPLILGNQGDVFFAKLDTNFNGVCQLMLEDYNVRFGIDDVAIDEQGNAFVLGNNGGLVRIEKISSNCESQWGLELNQYNLPYSVAEHQLKSIKVSPNPTSGTFYFHDLQGAFDVEVYNLLGEQVYVEHGISNKTGIELNSPKGLYLVHVLQGEERYVARVVIE